MFDRLDDMLIHYEELMLELNNPSVTEDQNRFRRLMKEHPRLSRVFSRDILLSKSKGAPP